MPIQVYLLKDFAKIPFFIVLENQVDINIHDSKRDQQRSNWSYALLFHLMTVKFFYDVIPTYNEICSSQQGGITITKLVQDKIFFFLAMLSMTSRISSRFFRAKV